MKHQPTIAEPDPLDADKLLAWQIEQLAACKRLRANPDFHAVLGCRLAAGKIAAHNALLDPTVSDSKLRVAQARYIAVRDLASLLDSLEKGLEESIRLAQENKDAQKSATAAGLGEIGGWFHVPPAQTTKAEES